MGIMDKIFDKDKDDDKDKKKADFSDVNASSASAAPAARADFSDVQSSSSTTAPRTYESPRGGQRTYTVVSGDTLSKIAKREYGDANKWHAIYDANRDKIKNPDLIHPGQVLTLPPNA